MKQRDKTNLRKCFIVACTIQDLVNGVCGEKRVKKKHLCNLQLKIKSSWFSPQRQVGFLSLFSLLHQPC